MMALLFQLCFLLAAPFWLLMIAAPGWRWTHRIVSAPWIVAGPVLIYLVVVLPSFGQVFSAVLTPSLDGVRTLLATPVGTTAVWAHVIAFDLFVGRWMYLDSRARGLHPLLMAPVLVLTILLAPIGFALYLVLRDGVRSGRTAESAVSAG
jgi:hypothetical protein